MKNLHNFNKLRLHFIGIGGISMSGLSKLALSKKAKVSGSDIGDGKELDILRSLGVQIYTEHKAENISRDTDLVVYSGAIKSDNPELKRAEELGISTMERSEFLGLVANDYDKVIAVSGTHGKTTTTAMLGLIMRYAGLNPTIHLGGESVNLKGNTIIGGHEYFLVEACEYRESFKYLNPYIAVITNIELDHLDYYPDYNSIYMAFSRFASRSSSLICLDGINIRHQDLVSIGSDWSVKQVECVDGGYNFNVFFKGAYYQTFRLNCIGFHNVINALFAIAIAHKLNIDKEIMSSAISDFMGVERRYERVATLNNGCNVIIDYAHHPTEIQSSIEGINEVYKRVLYVFQPHTYSRTLKLFDEFVNVLSGPPNVVIFKTYPARESLITGGTAKDLFDALDTPNKAYFDSLDKLIDYMNANSSSYDCVLVLGAGDLAEKMKKHFHIRL